jgi:hypothetical protein
MGEVPGFIHSTPKSKQKAPQPFPDSLCSNFLDLELEAITLTNCILLDLLKKTSDLTIFSSVHKSVYI